MFYESSKIIDVLDTRINFPNSLYIIGSASFISIIVSVFKRQLDQKPRLTYYIKTFYFALQQGRQTFGCSLCLLL